MITREVSRAISGDSFKTINGDIIKISGIVSPRVGEYMHEESLEFLGSLISGKMVQMKLDQRIFKDGKINASVTIKIKSPDPDSHSLCNIAKRMLIKGYARLDDGYEDTPLEMAQLIAIDEKRGVWNETAKFNWTKAK